MKTFLEIVANDLYKRHEAEQLDLAKTAVVFPNKRATLFFNDCLARQAEGKPLWAPAGISIGDLFQTLSPMHQADQILLICKLYEAYTQVTHSEETLDDFFFWGVVMLEDFDDVDKNMVDADKLFGNLSELKDIDGEFDYLTEEQRQALGRFFKKFEGDRN